MTTRRRFLAAVGAAVAGAGVAGCGYRPGGGDVRWRERRPSGLYGDDPVGVADGHLYGVAESVRSFDFETERWYTGGRATAYDAGDGSQRFSREFDSRIATHALGDRGLALAFEADGEEGSESRDDGGGESEVARLTGDGVQWRATVADEPGVLAAAGDRVYAVAPEGRVVACAGGSREWTAELPGGSDASEDQRGRRSVAVGADAEAVVAATETAVAGYDPGGRRRWTRRDVETPESIVVSGGRALVWADLDVLALDPETGETRWTLPGEVESVALAADCGYRIGDGELVAFDSAGERRWSASSGDEYLDRYGDRVAADADGVYATRGGELLAHEPADGSVRWSVDTSVSDGPYVADSGVLVVSDGDLVCHYATDQF